MRRKNVKAKRVVEQVPFRPFKPDLNTYIGTCDVCGMPRHIRQMADGRWLCPRCREAYMPRPAVPKSIAEGRVAD